MIKLLYRLLPYSIRGEAYLAVREQVYQDEIKKAEEIEASLPKLELTPEHIRNLRILTDREAFLAVLPKHSYVAEIGVARGDFSKRILEITKPKKLHLIDSWAHDDRYLDLGDFIKDRFQQEIKLGIVHVHRGISTEAMQKFESKIFDWVYIDTNHDYNTTTRELEICRTLVKSDGIIAGHDYVTYSWLGQNRFGVVEAVHEFCLKHYWEMIYLTHESHRHLSFAPKHISD